MTKSDRKKEAVSVSKKLINKIKKKQEKNIDSISLKRFTRSNTLLKSIDDIEREEKT